MIVVHTHGFDTLDMKPLVKFPANRLDLFIIIKTKRKKKLYHFSTHIGIKSIEGHYIWYQNQV